MDEADPRAKLEPFQALIGEWTIEMTHPIVEDMVIRGRVTYEWLEGGRFLIQRSVNDHPDFPDSLCVIGVMEGENDLSIQYFDSRGVHRVYAIGFDGSWDGDYMDVGTRLLKDVLDRARALGAEQIEHVIDDPPMRPQFQHHPEQRTELLESVGFAFRRETGRFEWRGGEPPVVPRRLSFRTLEEVGEEAYVEAMRMVSEGTLDREIQGEREMLGAKQAAREFFEDARRVEHEPSWWRLAYTAEEELVGLVIPAEPPGFLTIFYVGVVPEMRGQANVDDLLAFGTAMLLEARRRNMYDKPLKADTDVANGPMAAAFERVGWARFARRREYTISGMKKS
jgi:hypothetical protein